MNLNTTKEKLRSLRAAQRMLRNEIDAVRAAIREAGEDPDAPEIDLVPRNKEMYRQWKTGKTFVQISNEFSISPTTARKVCNRIEHILTSKSGQYDVYKDLER